MRLRVRYFAIQRELVGRREEEIELSNGATVGDAWVEIATRHPELASSGPSVRFARNGSYSDTTEELTDGDELAIIPPVAGGSAQDTPPTQRRRLALTAEPISEAAIADLCRYVASEADGAVVTFVGRTREAPGTPAPGQEDEAARFLGQPVVALEYEAYESMAINVLGAIADEIEARYRVGGLAILHRLGTVALGEASVAIAAAAPHRAAAFDACRYAIEELKARAPIWKSERFADGRIWLGTPARVGPVEAGPGLPEQRGEPVDAVSHASAAEER
ncbi:MAG TPA: MoaD family protein [Candidatus Limnocylindrales bacterium]|nr:MoaD family protein [Candidatus Limnocylindrales bacterium]